jgi:hypothetical protein
MFGSQRCLVLIAEWLTRLPVCGSLPQISQRLAIFSAPPWQPNDDGFVILTETKSSTQGIVTQQFVRGNYAFMMAI